MTREQKSIQGQRPGSSSRTAVDAMFYDSKVYREAPDTDYSGLRWAQRGIAALAVIAAFAAMLKYSYSYRA